MSGQGLRFPDALSTSEAYRKKYHVPLPREFTERRAAMSMDAYHVIVAAHSKYQIELQAIHCGADYSVIICGGERGHVGAVALGCNESGINGHENRGATVSVLCALGHRDDEVVRWAAKYLATELKCNISVSAGIHVENASGEDIQCLLENCKAACRQFIANLQSTELGRQRAERECG